MSIFYIVGCFIFIIFQGLFASSEIAFITSNTFRLRHRINKGDKSAKRAHELIRIPERFLATALVGTNLSVVISSSFATLFLINLGFTKSNLWITFLFTPIVVIFAELIPKHIGRFYKEKFSCRFSSFVRFFEVVFFPAVTLIEKVSRFLIRPLIGKKRKRSFFVTKEEIKSIVREITSEGVIDRGEQEAIEDVLGLREDRIRKVRTPLKRVIGFDYTDPKELLLKKARQYAFTRYPVFKNRFIVGYINIFDLFYKEGQWITHIRPIMHVGENQKLYDVLTALGARKENIAVVMRGQRPLGIVTLEDIIRELITSIIKD